jgi:Ser/Thr protein kinase RdoA (MazF antagonist)
VTRGAGAQEALAAARAFRLEAAPTEATPLGRGHIHDTFSVTCAGPAGTPHYVVQRINTHVFPDPWAVAANVALVTSTLRERLARRHAADAVRRCLRCLETRSGALLHTDPEGRVWRAFVRIEGAVTLDRVDSPARARAAAFAFADFAALLADLEPGSLRETLPGFHDFAARAAAFEREVARDAHGRAAACAPEIEALRRGRERLEREVRAEEVAALPVRTVHNDCKLNNVLFDAASGDALCVIDLDTVMPGHLLADFGDLVRTAACYAPEDTRDIEGIRVEPELYQALADGYMSAAAPLLTPAECELLPLGGPLITLELALRFATDHLGGDLYFPAAHPGHNLDRARSQARLAEHLLDRLADAHRAVRRAARAASLR